MTFKTFRTEGVLDSAEARKKTIVMIGLGSLGSEIAIQLAFEWKKLILIDPGTLDIENIERHHLGLSYLGKSKAHAMRDFLIKENGIPANSIEAYAKYSNEILPKIKEADLLICSIDHQPSCRDINDWCVTRNVPVIYGGVYPKGTGGDTIVLPKPADVCYLCAENSRNALDIVATEHANNYGIDPELVNKVEEEPKAVVALRNSIFAISVDVASMAFDVLFTGDRVTPTLLYRSITDWVDVAQITKSTELTALTMLIGVKRGLLLSTDLLKLSPPDKDGWQRLSIRRMSWPKVVSRWARCPKHGPVHNISDL